MKASLLALAALALIPLALAAQTPTTSGVSVRVISKTAKHKGIQSDIYRKSGNQIVPIGPTDGQGIARFASLSCSGEFSLLVVPRQPLYENREETCAPSVTAELTRIGYSSYLEPAFSGHFAAGLSSDPRILAARAEFDSAAAAGELGNLAAAANELAALYRSLGHAEIAGIYSAVAIESAGRVLLDPAAEGSTALLRLGGPDGNRLEESDAANQLLRRFQLQTNGLPETGRWDYRTFQAIRVQAQQDRSGLIPG